MPAYDYRCSECGIEFEVCHGMLEKPDVSCERCGASASKIPSACGIVVHDGGASAMRDSVVRQHEARQDLKENYGVEGVTPLGGETFDSVYRDIKGSGSMVKDKMQAERAVKEEQSRRKRREWAVKANKRVGKKTREAQEKKAKEAAAARAISVS